MTTPTAQPDGHLLTAIGFGAEPLDVLVIGAGQAGLAVGYHLKRAGLRFLIVDAADEVGDSWRSRWDSLRLFTPAQYDGLPGLPFPAPTDSYPTRTEVAAYLHSYAARFQLPVLLDTAVTRLVRDRQDRFVAHTSRGPLLAGQVVVATGPFQTPVVPVVGAGLDASVRQLHSADYRNPTQVRPGRVVIVGAGNSGRQIALELAGSRSSGRPSGDTGDHQVTLAVGTRNPELPHRALGRDLFWWLTRTRLITRPATSRIARRTRARGDLVIGSSLQQLAAAGVEIRPRLTDAAGGSMTFADGTQAQPTTIIWATGYRSDYSWIDIDGATDATGDIQHDRGLSPADGLAYIGLPWQHTRGSALLGFVKDDASWLAQRVISRTRTASADRA